MVDNFNIIIMVKNYSVIVYIDCKNNSSDKIVSFDKDKKISLRRCFIKFKNTTKNIKNKYIKIYHHDKEVINLTVDGFFNRSLLDNYLNGCLNNLGILFEIFYYNQRCIFISDNENLEIELEEELRQILGFKNSRIKMFQESDEPLNLFKNPNNENDLSDLSIKLKGFSEPFYLGENLIKEDDPTLCSFHLDQSYFGEVFMFDTGDLNYLLKENKIEFAFTNEIEFRDKIRLELIFDEHDNPQSNQFINNSTINVSDQNNEKN